MWNASLAAKRQRIVVLAEETPKISTLVVRVAMCAKRAIEGNAFAITLKTPRIRVEASTATAEAV